MSDISLDLNKVYAFTFATKFASLNDVYKVSDITTFENALINGVDFTKSLYTPVNLTATDYNNDYTNYAGGLVYTLVSPKDDTITYPIPESLIATLPDPTVVRFPLTYLAVTLGYFATTDKYSYIKSQIEDLVLSVAGTGQTTQFMHADKSNDKWMTLTEYNRYDAERTATIVKKAPQAATIIALQSTIASLRARLNACEELLIQAKANKPS